MNDPARSETDAPGCGSRMSADAAELLNATERHCRDRAGVKWAKHGARSSRASWPTCISTRHQQWPVRFAATSTAVSLTVKGPAPHSRRGRLPPGEIGEIWFERSVDFRYLNDDEKTAGSRRPGGNGTFGGPG
jgi:hypothetical protein